MRNFKEEANDCAKAKESRMGVKRAAGGETTAESRLKKYVPEEIKQVADNEVHKHEKHMHAGKKPTKLKRGGKAVLSEGAETHERLDRVRRKDGGRAKKKGDVNIVIATGGGQPASAPPSPILGQRPPMPVAPPVPSAPNMQGPAGAPQVAAMPPTGMPLGSAPRKSGGRSPDYEGGSGGALGRLEKAAEYGARK